MTETTTPRVPPTYIVLDPDGDFLYPGTPDNVSMTGEEVRKYVPINVEHPENKRYIAAWNGHEFEIIEPRTLHTYAGGFFGQMGYHPKQVHETAMHIYFPIDPRMTLEDIRGATIKYHNEAGDAWLFAHCDEDYMLDHEHKLEAAVDARFGREINEAQIKVNEATNATVKAQVVTTHSNLVAFCNDVTDAVHDEARTRHIGYYHQNPHEAHIHAVIARAIDTVTAKWQVDMSTEYRTINTHVGRVLKTLTKQHVYETRWDREARIEAEKKAAAAVTVSPKTPGSAEPEA